MILKSQIATSNSTDIQGDRVLMSQSVISKPVERRGGTQKLPYAFTENGVAMLSSVLRSMEYRKQPKRRPIGFIQPKENDSEDEQEKGTRITAGSHQ